MRGQDLKDVLEIPPPITEQNKDKYLEDLSKIKESEDWIKKHSTQNNGNQEEIRIIQIDNSADGKIVYRIFIAIAISVVSLIFAVYCLPALIVIYLFNYY